jgi:23S rRNA (adenine1618-N6)-methyltransferase
MPPNDSENVQKHQPATIPAVMGDNSRRLKDSTNAESSRASRHPTPSRLALGPGRKLIGAWVATPVEAARPTPTGAGSPHPRNRHRERYEFHLLIDASPELKQFIRAHPIEGSTIEFSDPTAVKALNRALLIRHYGLNSWDIPAGYLCPPIPSRADYIHHLADLLASDNGGTIPRGGRVRIFDLGMGANCVYGILAVAEYDWRIVGSDIDRHAVNWARSLVAANANLRGKIECRVQPSETAIFDGVLSSEELFHAVVCNPPFHASALEAELSTQRKVRNLGLVTLAGDRNFGGRNHELWCEGGEAGFIQRMVSASTRRSKSCLWFTTLVSKRGSLPGIYRELKRARVVDVRTAPFAQGQKQSRIVAWTFLSTEDRKRWLSAGANASS